MRSRRLAVSEQIDVVATMRSITPRAASGLPGGSGEAWWVGATPDGAATLRVTGADRTLSGEAWGPGSEWVLDRLEVMCGVDDEGAPFEPPPGLVARLHRSHPGLRLGRTGLVFAALLPVILGQRVTSVSAKRSLRSMARAYGVSAPGPVDAWVPPPAEVVAGLDHADLHPHGVERGRAQILIEAARRSRRLEETPGMGYGDAYRRLTALRGIGPWTAGHVMGIALGDPDAVPVGDYHLPNTVAWALSGEERGDDARMLELLEPYRPHRRRAVMLLELAAVHAPKLGPRTAVEDITRR